MAMQICKTVRVWPCISHVSFIDSHTFCNILGAAVQERARPLHPYRVYGGSLTAFTGLSCNSLAAVLCPHKIAQNDKKKHVKSLFFIDVPAMQLYDIVRQSCCVAHC